MGDTVRVLLVDDDPAVAELTATYLTRLDESLTATVETDPTSALDRLDAERFDCIVSDYEMPEMNGLAFFEEASELAPKTPFVLFTGKGSEEIASEAISTGVTDYLQKEVGTEQYEVLANRVRNVVAQRRAEREATGADEQRRRMLERITDAFFALDDDWQFQYVNERAGALLGVDPEDLVGEDVREAFPETGDSDFYDAYRRAVETQEPTTVEAEMSVNSGTWIEARAFPSADGLSVYGRDVTDRKRMESELRETKAKREALYDVATRAVACSSEDELYDLAVEVAEDILEFSFCAVDVPEDGELVKRAVSEDIPEDGYYGTVPVDSDESLAARVYRDGETSLVGDLAAAGYTPAESKYRAALTVPLGDFAVFQAVSDETDGFDEDDRELTELLAAHLTGALRRIESEQALRAERDRFAALFENVPNSVVGCVYEDGEPVAKAVNPAFEETFGWDAETVVGDELDEFIVPPGAQAEADALNERIVRGARVEGAELTRVTTDGLRDFLLNTATVRDDDETEDVSVYTDITAQKERERKLARQNERLDEFASVVSHDLRNPLNVALGRFDLLADECDSVHLDPIDTALDRMDELVANLLTLARLSEPVVETESVELAGVAQAAWATAETADADLRVAGDPTVEADPGRLRQLLENLFRNAVEHGSTSSQPEADDAVEYGSTSSRSQAHEDAVEHGGDGVSVRVGALGDSGTASSSDEPTSADGFYVEDDGPGIPAEERDRVFEYGFTTDERGTGFGLSIVADVAEAHGWSVELAESEEGGARFECRT